MPKCASTALETALAPHMDVVISKLPGAKHTNYRKYQRHLKRYFETYTDGPLETVCLFREPVAWLNSWWRYRARSTLVNPARSTQGLDFDTFVRLYLNDAEPPADLGRQSRFVINTDREIGVDRLFRYENLDALVAFLAERMEVDLTLTRSNVSPAAHASEALQTDTEDMLRKELALDFEIYASIA